MIELVLFFLLIGLIGGFIAGLIGTGSSLLILPVLILVFPHLGVSQSLGLHMALVTSMAILCITSVITAINHYANGKIRWDVIRLLVMPTVMGGLVGTYTSQHVTKAILQNYLAIFLVIIAIRLWLRDRNPVMADSAGSEIVRPVNLLMMVLAGSIAFVSASAGVAMGVMLIPFLCYKNLSMREALPCSVILGIPYVFATTIFNLLCSFHIHNALSFSMGYLYLPAFIAVSLGILISNNFGAKMSIRCNQGKLKRIFSIFLLFSAGMMYIKY